jgi:serine/threonine-protein kinase RsbW
MTAWTQRFAGKPESAGAARAWAARHLAACPNADDVVLAVSELVTNSAIHSRSAAAGTIEVRMVIWPGQWVGVTVSDDGPALPAGFRDGTGAATTAPWPVTKPGPEKESGRGLWLCSELSAECEWNGRGLHWCRLPWGTPRWRRSQP